MTTESTSAKSKFGLIYLVLLEDDLKLGFTWNLEKRLRLLAKSNTEVVLLESVVGTKYIEKQLHEMLGCGMDGLYHFDYEQQIREAMHSVRLILHKY
jgi:hypothetical protein